MSNPPRPVPWMEEEPVGNVAEKPVREVEHTWNTRGTMEYASLAFLANMPIFEHASFKKDAYPLTVNFITQIKAILLF